jgi:hypothetical protein
MFWIFLSGKDPKLGLTNETTKEAEKYWKNKIITWIGKGVAMDLFICSNWIVSTYLTILEENFYLKFHSVKKS